METMWFYASGNERKGPVTEGVLLGMVSEGTVKATDLVWSEGMADWVPFSATVLASRVGSAAAPSGATTPPPAPSPLPASPFTREQPAAATVPLQPVPQGISGWMKFNGIMLIIQGGFACLSCVGIIIGAPMIVAGIASFGAADVLDNLGGVSGGTVPLLEKLRTMNLWFGIYHIIMLCVVLLYFVIVLIFGAAMFAAMGTLVEQAGKGGMP